MFKNKHVIIAMIVAPILSVLAWFAVGQFLGEQPQAAKPGQSYPLVEQSNCRYRSGACDLENEDFRLRLTLQQGVTGPEFLLSSSHPLEGAVLAVVEGGADATPAAMRASDGQGLAWRIVLAEVPAPADRIRLVARAGGSSYFADASTAFLQPGDD
ncbi:hypothetical protein DWB85_11610 [Seongchinamella sediminis]|uniref:Uncharacterized protein n=1 Tax=Seongchinamella sediminis TaxID=2283635 RepID=A0A3L7DWG1_9GAMM|nr:hypothetical protein [Seongchinamella sediminis]RLQ21654.1 hypothetical protein DWB85_11610 [Seongchinamella sediminis]